MAVLSDAQREALWADMMRTTTCEAVSGTMTKSQMRDAINAVDDWLSNNAAAIEGIFDASAKSGLSKAVRLKMFGCIAKHRAENGVT